MKYELSAIRVPTTGKVHLIMETLNKRAVVICGCGAREPSLAPCVEDYYAVDLSDPMPVGLCYGGKRFYR